MMIKFAFILSLLLQLGCQRLDSYNLVGKWQSLNDPESVIEFTLNKEIVLYKKGQSIWSQATKNGELKYEFSNDQRNWFAFEAFDGKDLFMKGRIEIVDKKRIRIYFHKHHDILDMADEYYRTNDFESFPSIMKDILKESE